MNEKFAEKFQKLFFEVNDFVSSGTDEKKPITEALKLICDFFMFDCGFVYETGYLGEYKLEETYCAENEIGLPNSIFLGEYIEENEKEDLFGKEFIFLSSGEKGTNAESNLLKLFGAKSLLVTPITAENKNIIGLVGLLHRGGEIIMPKIQYDSARSLCIMLANYIKLRIYKRKFEGTRSSLEGIMDNMGIDIYVNDYFTHEVLYVNQSMAAPYGGPEHFRGKTCWDALYDDKKGECDFCPKERLLDKDGNPTVPYTWDYKRPFDGSWFRVVSAAFQWMDGRLAHVVSSVDITKNKQNEETINRMANHDFLTGLPSRRKMLQDCAANIEEMQATGQEGYMLFIGLDGFKSVNDTFGHKAGDKLLKTVGVFFAGCEKTKGSSYRHGGDEFIVLLKGVSETDVQGVQEALLQRFGEPWHIDLDREVNCGASVGIACYPSDGVNTEDLLRAASGAMHEAKARRKDKVCFYRDIKER